MDNCQHLELGVRSLEHEPVWVCRECKQTVRLDKVKGEFAYNTGNEYGTIALENWIRNVMTMKNQQAARESRESGRE